LREVGALPFQQLLHLEVVVGAEDRSARNRRDDLDVLELVQLGEPGEYPDVEQRCAKSAAG